MTRRGAGFSVVAAVGVLLFGVASPAGAVVNNFGVDISSASGTPTTPIYTPVSFYGGETNGNQTTTTFSVKIENIGDTITFPIHTSGLLSVILAAELFLDGRFYESDDTFKVSLTDSTTPWVELGDLVGSSSTAVPLREGPPFTYGSQASNTDNVFFPVGPAFYDGILSDTLQVKIVKTVSGGNTTDFINGVNLQVSSTTPVPEPTSMLLFGTMLAGLGWASRKRFSR